MIMIYKIYREITNDFREINDSILRVLFASDFTKKLNRILLGMSSEDNIIKYSSFSFRAEH